MPTKIEWTDETWNPTTGCSALDEGCDHCWARKMAYRLRGRYGYPQNGPFRPTFHPERLGQPARWRKPRRIACCLMGDLFHPLISADEIGRIFSAAESADQHTYLMLTKRIKRAARFAAENLYPAFVPSQHIWIGTTIVNQPTAEQRSPAIAEVNSAVRFVSFEPLLGPIEPLRLHELFQSIQWVIVGCESIGNRAGRFQDGFWQAAKHIVKAAKDHSVPVFVKQVPLEGKVSHNPDEWPRWARRREFPDQT